MDIKSFFSRKAEDIKNAFKPYTPYVGQVAQGIGRDIVNLNNRVSGSANKAFNQTFVPWSKDFQQQNQQFTNYSRTLPETSLGGRTAQFMEGVRTSVPGMNLAFRQSAANDPTTTGGQLARLGGAAVPAVLTAGTLGKGSFGSNLLRATPELGLSAGLGAGINTAFGGSPIMGAAQGLQAYNYTKPIGSITNPFIEKFAGKAAGGINNPFTRGIVGRGATGLGNVPEGMIMNASMGQPYTPFDFAMDTGTGVLFGGGAGNLRPKNDFMAGSKGAKNLGQEIGTQAGDFMSIYDKQLRREISDSASKINLKELDNLALNGMTGLNDLIKHQKLFKAYPELRGMKVEIDPSYVHSATNGSFDPFTKVIKLNPDLGNANNVKGVLLHEIQHAIQTVEGFAKGSSPNVNDPRFLNWVGKNYGRVTDKDALEELAKRFYLLNFGEVESTSIQRRMNLPQSQLSKSDPYAKVIKDRDIQPNQVIVDMPGGGSMANVDPLIEEARKYKSAEEFVKGKLKNEPMVTLYRGSKTGKVHSDIKDFTFFATNPEYAKQYMTKGEKLVEYKLPESALLRDSINNEEVQYLADTRNPKIKQLTDIWNKANQTSTVDPLIQEAKKYKSAEEFVKAQQLKKISKENPMTDSYHTGIRNISDIKTFRETLNDPESFVNPDFTKEMAENALKSGEITIYSSKPLDKAVSQFATPSKMMASDYAGNGKVYSRKVDVNDVAWINGDEGNFVGESQLSKTWNQANKGEMMSMGEGKNLLLEARKYSSPEEWLQAVNSEKVREAIDKGLSDLQLNKYVSREVNRYFGSSKTKYVNLTEIENLFKKANSIKKPEWYSDKNLRRAVYGNGKPAESLDNLSDNQLLEVYNDLVQALNQDAKSSKILLLAGDIRSKKKYQNIYGDANQLRKKAFDDLNIIKDRFYVDDDKLPLFIEDLVRRVEPIINARTKQGLEVVNQARGVDNGVIKPPIDQPKLTGMGEGINKQIETERSINENVNKIQKDFLDGKITMEQRKILADKEFARSSTPNQLPKQEVKGDKYAFNINKKTLGTSEKANEVIDQAVEQARPILEANKGKKLTHKEIIREGKKAAILDKVMTREETADFAAKLQATRNMLKSQSESTGITQEYLDNLAVLSSTAADAGRRLNAFSVGAEDVSLKQQVVKELLDVGVEANKIIEGAKNVDWNNAKQVTEFYRKYKPARLGEYLTEFRYTNMLSSPLTHIVNTFSNLLQGGVVAPVEKTVAGGLDFAYSKLTGAERKYFASQGIDYTKGFVKAIPEAFDNFRKAFSGGAELSRPDLEMIPTTTNKYWNLYKTPLTALEAADQFFKTLVRSGEMESLKRVGKTGAEAEQIASRKADYRLFRQAFDPEGKLGQGKVLQYWDKWNSQINRMRQLPGGKWIVPFLQTPTNILKQGVEYSPLGVFTAIGAKEPIEQLSKASIGSAVFMTAYGLANSGLTTWDAPTSAKEKEEFYAAGLQPYSIKMGDKWVSYSKLGPLSYPIAMASALKWAGDNNGGDDVMSNLGNGIGGSLQFFADQSYVRGIGDIIDALRGDEYKQSRALANIPLQTIPYDSFQGWVTRIIDPVYRKTSSKSIPDAIKTNIMAKTPGLSNQLPAYQTPFGEQSNRQFPKFNAVSPFAVTQENPNYMAYYKNKQVERNANRELTAAKNEAKATLTSSGNISNQGEKVFYNDGTSVNTLDLGKYAKKPTDPIDAIRLTRDQYSDALKVFRADGPSKQEKSDIIRKIGLKPEDISYYDIASDTEDIKQIVVSQAVQGSKTREQLISNLIMLTKEVNGKKVLSDTAINELAKRGIISKTEQTFLKNIENVNGKLSLKPQSFKPKAPKVFKGKQADVKYNFYDPKIARLSTQSGVGAYQAPTPRLDVNLDELRNPTAPKFRLK